MKTLKTTIVTITITVMAFAAISCKESKKNESSLPMGNEMHQEGVENGEVISNGRQDAKATEIVDGYLSIKDALVSDDSEKAAGAGSKLVATFENFELSGYSDTEQRKLKKLIDNASEHAEYISDSQIEKQREHFKTLSTDITDWVAITKTDKKLYEQFCPMYDRGSAWLSASNEIRNPYYGSKMLTCGKVQREIE